MLMHSLYYKFFSHSSPFFVYVQARILPTITITNENININPSIFNILKFYLLNKLLDT